MAAFEKKEDVKLSAYLKQMLLSLTGLKLDEEGLLLLENTTKAITHALQQIALLEQELIRQNKKTIDKPWTTPSSKDKSLDDFPKESLKVSLKNLEHLCNTVESNPTLGKHDSIEPNQSLPPVKKLKVEEPLSKSVIPKKPDPYPILDCIDLTDDLDTKPASTSPRIKTPYKPSNPKLNPEEKPLTQRKDSLVDNQEKHSSSPRIPLVLSDSKPKEISQSKTSKLNNLSSTEEKDLPGKPVPHSSARKNEVSSSPQKSTQSESELLLNAGYTAFMTTRSCELNSTLMMRILNKHGISGVIDVLVFNKKSRSYAFVSFDTPDNFKHALELGGTILVNDYPLFIYPQKDTTTVPTKKDKNAPLFPWKKKQKLVFQGTYKRFED